MQSSIDAGVPSNQKVKRTPPFEAFDGLFTIHRKMDRQRVGNTQPLPIDRQN
jgi:hypothetical protein